MMKCHCCMDIQISLQSGRAVLNYHPSREGLTHSSDSSANVASVIPESIVHICTKGKADIK